MTGRTEFGRSITAFLFDYGDTLATISPPEEALEKAYCTIHAVLSSAAPAANLPPPSALRATVAPAFRRALDEATVAKSTAATDIIAVTEAAYGAIGAAVDRKIAERLYLLEQDAWATGATLLPATMETLGSLRRAGIRIGICSNAIYPEAVFAQLTTTGLVEVIDTVTISALVGCSKPDPEIFRIACQALGAVQEQTCMVGDRWDTDIVGAAAAGLHTIRMAGGRDDPAPPGQDAAVVIHSLGALVELVGLTS